MNFDRETIAVIGLGYVGLPLAVEFAKLRPVVGFDIDAGRIAELRGGRDSKRGVSEVEMAAADHLIFTQDSAALAACKVFIVTVPTPVDDANRPDLEPLRMATEIVGRAMPPGALIIYESTVYPGCTEEYCVPLLERQSGLKLNRDFYAGYSPERLEPGDAHHRLTTITKVTSGSTPEAAEAVDRLYASIIPAGTHRASSIKVAEAAKVIENTQRDVNIAFMNELALILNRLGLDTLEVLEAAGTKWNFMPFRPGLAGGHCTCVDPYYLTHKAEEAGYRSEVILAGRRVNEGMGAYVADQVVKLMAGRGVAVAGSRVLIMGLAFKENRVDVRNSKVADVIDTLLAHRARVDVHDPLVDPGVARRELDIACMADTPAEGVYDAIIVAVGHRQFIEAGAARARGYGKTGAVLYDVKGIYPRSDVDGRL